MEAPPQITCIESLRKEYENPTEWKLRKSFLHQNWKSFPFERLECLSHCFVSIEIYGSTYPSEVMQVVKQCSEGLVDQVLQKRRRIIGAPEPVKFVAATKTLDNRCEELSSTSPKDPRINRSFQSETESNSSTKLKTCKYKQIAFVSASSPPVVTNPPSIITQSTSQISTDKKNYKPIAFVAASSPHPDNESNQCKQESLTNPTPSKKSRTSNEENVIGSNHTQSLSIEERFQLSELHRILADRAELCRQLINTIHKLIKSQPQMNPPALVNCAASKLKAAITTIFEPYQPKVFKCCAWLEGDTLLAEGLAPSKKIAKSNAFEQFLAQYGHGKIEVVENENRANSYCVVSRESLKNHRLSSSELPVKPETTIMKKNANNNQQQAESPEFLSLCDSIYVVEYLSEIGKSNMYLSRLSTIAQNFGLTLEYQIENTGSSNDNSKFCKLLINEIFTSTGSGINDKEAKKMAAGRALDKLKQHCWSLIYKQAKSFVTEVSKNGITKQESHKTKETRLSSSNIGAKLMQKMGYKEGSGLGRLGEGRVDPVSSDMTQIDRSGLGADSNIKTFKKNIATLLENYARSNQEEDLFFSTEFTNEERKFIHGKCNRLTLITKSYDTEDGGRCLFVGRKRTPMELFAWVKRSGGNTTRYQLLPPGTDYEELIGD